ncbi:MAG: hypothetical protein U0271_41690 [Polyangiaceae bacterium]
MQNTRLLLIGYLAIGLGCGAKVVYSQGDGDGGSGGGSSTNGTSSSTTSTGVDCAQLQADYLSKFDQATACNTCIDFDACGVGQVISDPCGCPAGTSDQGLATAAQEAFDAWVAAGCGPELCGEPCFGGDVKWFCSGDGTNCNGKCTAAF